MHHEKAPAGAFFLIQPTDARTNWRYSSAIMKNLLLLSLLIAQSLTGCASTPPADPPAPLVNVPVTLTVGKTATLRPGLSLSFDRANDSRCPQGVQCVWAGRLLYMLTLHGKQDEPFTLGTTNTRFTSSSGITVELANKEEAPLPVHGQPPPAYTVMLLVNSN